MSERATIGTNRRLASRTDSPEPRGRRPVHSQAVRALRWLGWECLTLVWDLIRWYRAIWYAFPDAAATVLVVLLLAPVAILYLVARGTIPVPLLIEALVRIAAIHAVIAAVTAVPRGRARIRRRIRDAVQAVVGRTTHVGRAKRCRWRGQQLQSADVIPPAIWRDGRDTRRADLAEQLAWRLQDGGSFAVSWVIDRGRPVARVHRAAQLPASLPARSWQPPTGVVLVGATEPHTPGTVDVDGLPFAGWSWKHDPHLLMAGSTGTGKTSVQRWITRSLLATAAADGRRMQLVGIDGKGAGSLAYLHGRQQVLGVGDEPREWIDLIRAVQTEMEARYKAIRAWRRGDEPRPRFDQHIGVVVDELVDIRDTAGDAFMEPFAQVVRLGREAGIHVASSVLRPDVTDSLPGLIRASHSARLMLGTLHDETTAKMLFTARWRDALDAATDDDGSVSGRGIALLAGRIYRVQIPWVPDPADDPAGANRWLPPRLEPDPEPQPPDRTTPARTADVVPLTTKSARRRTAVPGPRQAS